jgi:hypothetical protein
MLFYLGTHEPGWLATVDVPLFISRQRLAGRKRFPRAKGSWALDSGGFTELRKGGWTLAPRDYAAEVRRYQAEIGRLAWAAPQDWMCEPIVLRGGTLNGVRFVGTGLSVAEHQRLTTANLLELRTLAPDVPWTPVLQGWCAGDYYDHWEAYAKAGIDLQKEPLVGVGSVCRRQSTLSASLLMTRLASDGLKLHGFGFKIVGLRSIGGQQLASADSLAWSANARKNPPLPGHSHKSCSNCLEWALDWRREMLASIGRA